MSNKFKFKKIRHMVFPILLIFSASFIAGCGENLYPNGSISGNGFDNNSSHEGDNGNSGDNGGGGNSGDGTENPPDTDGGNDKTEPEKPDYDTEHWFPVTTVGDIPEAVFAKYSAAVSGDKIYYFGGYNTRTYSGNKLNEIHLFDTSSQIWSKTKATGVPDTYKLQQNTADTINGKIYLFAGQGGSTSETRQNDLLEYDPAANNIKKLSVSGSAPMARTGHASAVIGTTLYIYGGDNNGGAFMNDFYSIDLSKTSPAWKKLASTPAPALKRTEAAMAAYNGKIYMFGGIEMIPSENSSEEKNDLYEYDPSKNTWKQITGINMPPKRQHHTMTVLGDAVYMLGGSTFDRYSYTSTEYQDVWKLTFDPTPKWEEIQRPIGFGSYDANIQAVGNSMYVFSGGVLEQGIVQESAKMSIYRP